VVDLSNRAVSGDDGQKVVDDPGVRIEEDGIDLA
jgi:hypothetical protein